jgi:hypothetical protein
MDPEDNLLLLCARQDFADSHRQALLDLCAAENIAWERTLRTARHHEVAPLVWANLEKATGGGLSIPEDICESFQLTCYANVASKGKRKAKLVQTLAFLESHAIQVLGVKSVALDLLVYDQPWYTIAGDADLVLRPTEERVPDEVMAEIQQFFQGWAIEWELYEHHDVTMNGHLPVDFERIWRDARNVPFEGHELLLMSTEDMLLSLCINSARKRFFRLRSLVDIAETTSRCRQIDWSALVDKAGAYRCSHIAYTALLVTQTTLGCDLPEEVLDQLAPGPIRSAMLRRMIPSLIQRQSLDSLSYYTGWELFGRRMGPSLLLPYASETWRRIGLRIWGAYRAWRMGTE